MTFETFVQSYEKTRHDQKNYKDKYKDKDNDKDKDIFLQSSRLVTFETLTTILTIENLNS